MKSLFICTLFTLLAAVFAEDREAAGGAVRQTPSSSSHSFGRQLPMVNLKNDPLLPLKAVLLQVLISPKVDVSGKEPIYQLVIHVRTSNGKEYAIVDTAADLKEVDIAKRLIVGKTYTFPNDVMHLSALQGN